MSFNILRWEHEIQRLQQIIRATRDVLFNNTKRLYVHERQWETEEEEKNREETNKRWKKAWDTETEKLINGEE